MSKKVDQTPESTKNKRGGWKYQILPLSVKKQAVEEYLSGEIPIAEIAKKYGVTSPARIHSWVKQVERGEDRLMGGYKRIKKDLKMKIVREIITGQLTEKEALVKYNIAVVDSIRDWCSKFSPDINSSNSDIIYMKRAKFVEKDNEATNLNKVIRDLQEKVLGLETMIDVAEKEFKIEIRKKSGAKQSKL